MKAKVTKVELNDEGTTWYMGTLNTEKGVEMRFDVCLSVDGKIGVSLGDRQRISKVERAAIMGACYTFEMRGYKCVFKAFV